MKRRGGSSSKGGSYERKIAKALSLWVSNGERQDLYWRSGGSGSRATMNIALCRTQSGDIAAIAPEGAFLTEMFCLECKSYKTFYFDRILNNRVTGYLPKWKKLVAEAARAQKMPMFISKANFGVEMLATDSNGYQTLISGATGKVPVPLAWLAQLDIWMFRLSDVFEQIDPNVMKIPRRQFTKRKKGA